MNKIIKSLSVVAFVAAIAIAATGAYFSDTETSTGNTFTAGAIDLKVDNHCYYNGNECADSNNDGTYIWQSGPNIGGSCSCTWGLDDLDGHVFANFTDLKPGDNGEDTISFHVNSNDAWLCAKVTKTTDSDVDCTEPESEAEAACGTDGTGELDNYLQVFAWADVCDGTGSDYSGAVPGDNIYQPGCDIALMDAPKNIDDYANGQTFPIADSTYSAFTTDHKGAPVTGGEDYYIGKAWCFGDMTVATTIPANGETITCDGEPVLNDAQTDTLQLDVSFTAIQTRHNDNYVCQ